MTSDTGNKKILLDLIRRASGICLLGHTGPDGDAVGSTLALYNYIASVRGRDFAESSASVYLEAPSDKFSYLQGYGQIRSTADDGRCYELCIVCDCADETRPAVFAKYYQKSETSFLIDHHQTNPGFCTFRVIHPEASSTCEIVWNLLEEQYITKDIAECIYTGIVHDTGVFRYSCTSEQTMSIAGKCMSFGIDYSDIIDNSFFAMNFQTKKALGHVLSTLQSVYDGRLVYSFIDQKTMAFYQVTGKELDGVIDNIRSTTGALAAMFLYRKKDNEIKVSLRSNTDAVDVSTIAQKYGGGGHKRAAGFSMSRNLGNQDAADKIVKEFGTFFNNE